MRGGLTIKQILNQEKETKTMPLNHHCTCTNGDGNTNDYATMLKMLRKFNIPIVTIHKGNSDRIICFAANGTTEYVFDENELFDILPREITFEEWILTQFVIRKADESIITIYNY
jgi:hypothetical protein